MDDPPMLASMFGARSEETRPPAEEDVYVPAVCFSRSERADTMAAWSFQIWTRFLYIQAQKAK